MKILMNKSLIGLCFALLLGIVGCSRQQSDWEKTRAANTTDSYEQFIRKYPSGEFTAQAQARVKEVLRLNADHSFSEVLDLVPPHLAAARSGDEAKEGFRAFFEKRKRLALVVEPPAKISARRGASRRRRSSPPPCLCRL